MEDFSMIVVPLQWWLFFHQLHPHLNLVALQVSRRGVTRWIIRIRRRILSPWFDSTLSSATDVVIVPYWKSTNPVSSWSKMFCTLNVPCSQSWSCIPRKKRFVDLVQFNIDGNFKSRWTHLCCKKRQRVHAHFSKKKRLVTYIRQNHKIERCQ